MNEQKTLAKGNHFIFLVGGHVIIGALSKYWKNIEKEIFLECVFLSVLRS